LNNEFFHFKFPAVLAAPQQKSTWVMRVTSRLCDGITIGKK